MPSKSELKALGERRNYQDRELDARAVANLSSDEYLWFQVFYPTRLEDAAQRDTIKKHNKAAMKETEAQQFWNKYWGTMNQASPEEANRILAELQSFQASFPQFIASRTENQVILEWLRDRNLELTFHNLAQSFEANALEGRIYLNPNSIGAGSESEVTGTALTTHHNFHLLIQPQRRMTETDRLSADEYFAKNKDVLGDKRLPPIVTARREKAKATAAYFEQAAAATAKAGSTVVTDYPQKQYGVPPLADIEKASLRAKVKNMSSSELAEKCQNDPSFKKALDSLE